MNCLGCNNSAEFLVWQDCESGIQGFCADCLPEWICPEGDWELLNLEGKFISAHRFTEMAEVVEILASLK